MHSKMKGNIGEIAVAKTLSLLGYAVFKELGDLSKVDLITLVNNRPIKIQVKSSKLTNGAAHLSRRKCGPGYKFKYQKDQVDIFALYIPEKDIVIFVDQFELLAFEAEMVIRIEKSKNNQIKHTRTIDKYIDFNYILSEYEKKLEFEKSNTI